MEYEKSKTMWRVLSPTTRYLAFLLFYFIPFVFFLSKMNISWMDTNILYKLKKALVDIGISGILKLDTLRRLSGVSLWFSLYSFMLCVIGECAFGLYPYISMTKEKVSLTPPHVWTHSTSNSYRCAHSRKMILIVPFLYYYVHFWTNPLKLAYGLSSSSGHIPAPAE